MQSRPSSEFNDQPWGRWIFFLLLAAFLFWGGLAIRLKYTDNTVSAAYGRSVGILGMFLGITLFGTLLVIYVYNYLKK